MKTPQTADHIVEWLQEYHENSGKNFVVGVSGGVDSAVVSTLCAHSGVPTTLICLPHKQPVNTEFADYEKVKAHLSWLATEHENVSSYILGGLHTTDVQVMSMISNFKQDGPSELTRANTLARLRMTLLYAIASETDSIVVGTGNKVEDFGVGFFTKYGDGGVDISPIGDLYKSQVYDLASFLGISNAILEAPPADGLWEDGRTDEDQLGISYDDLEWAMMWLEQNKVVYDQHRGNYDTYDEGTNTWLPTTYSDKEKEALRRYEELHAANKHKMEMPPVCRIG